MFEIIFIIYRTFFSPAGSLFLKSDFFFNSIFTYQALFNYHNTSYSFTSILSLQRIVAFFLCFWTNKNHRVVSQSLQLLSDLGRTSLTSSNDQHKFP